MVSDILLSKIAWDGDCLSVFFLKHKGDQDGSRAFPRAIYANPLDPQVCPILSLGIKLLCEPCTTSRPVKLFPGKSQDSNFAKWISKEIDDLSEEEKSVVGCFDSDIGSHSGRKGAATFVCGITGGPDSHSVYLRMGHTLGGVADRYIFSSSGSDRYVGRSVCGLPHTSADFATLPPHFSRACPDIEWPEIVPNYSLYDSGIVSAIPFLVASVIYHLDWIRSNLPATHRIYSSKLFASDYLNRLRPFVIVGRFRCSDTGLQGTGILKMLHIFMSWPHREK
jgi:hypothetical protein